MDLAVPAIHVTVITLVELVLFLLLTHMLHVMKITAGEGHAGTGRAAAAQEECNCAHLCSMLLLVSACCHSKLTAVQFL